MQFPWDRLGNRDEHSSCWLRVNYEGAGAQFGNIILPRIGQEVIVDFFEGDPDQPFVKTRTYHANTINPYDLPANKTRMTMRSKTHKGEGFNEVRFEDEQGQEEIFIHAQKDQNNIVLNCETTEVGNDRSEHVGHDEKINIDNDRSEVVGNNENITIKNNRKEKVIQNESIEIGQNRVETVGKNETLKIKQNRQKSVGKNESLKVGANQKETIRKNRSANVGANDRLKVGSVQQIMLLKTKAETISGADILTVGIGYQETVGLAKNVSVGGAYMEEIGLQRLLMAGKSVEIVCGASSILFQKDGKIILNAKNIIIEASDTIEVLGEVTDLNGDSEVDVPSEEFFILKDIATKEPIKNRKYWIIRADGSEEAGTTDEEGKTHLVKSESLEGLSVEIEEDDE